MFTNNIIVNGKCDKCNEPFGIQLSREQIAEFLKALHENRSPKRVGALAPAAERETVGESGPIPIYSELRL